VDYLLKDSSIRLHNFAFPSATMEDDLLGQLSRFFARFPKKSPANPIPILDPNETIYVLFLDINDCGRISSEELEPIVEVLFDAVHDLYVKAGARNFVLVDVPPIDRSPSAVDSSDEVQNRVETWNDLLRTRASEFATSSPQATVLVFSSHKVLTDVLDDPLEYDFTEDDPADEGGAIWEDDLHLTPAVHAILADRLLASLKTEDQ
ncbi:uncharacterized protein EV420DRAFT_1266339, partial [Desarmillaria tabescens]